jgi:RND family efflux transporter MFP subunit
MKTAACLALLLLVSLSPAAGEPQGFDGVVLAFRSSMVNAKTVGNVSKVLVEEGQKVNEGDVLAQLDDAIPRTNYELSRLQSEDTSERDAAKLQLDQAERDLARAKTLKEQGTSAAMDLEKAQYSCDQTKITLASKQLDLQRLKAALEGRKAVLDEYAVRAPFSGIVAQKAIEVGETSAPVERRLFQIIDISRVFIEVHPEVARIKDVAVGDAATVVSDLFPDGPFPGSVSFVSPSLDPGGRYFGVKVLVDNPGGLLRPGMKARVVFGEKPSPAGQGGRTASQVPAASGAPGAAGETAK